MPLTSERSFRVRYTECDAYGHVNNANYLRYMQEAAFDATAAAGYPYEKYEEMGFLWLAYETQIEYLQPLIYNQHFTIKTWVHDFRRTRSRRLYEFRRGDELVATGSTDWVYLDSDTLRPARIPDSMMEAFYPEGVPDEAPRRPRFLQPPEPPVSVYKLQRRVEWRDIDLANHVNNAVYLAYIDDCGMEVTRALGWSTERMHEAGFGIIARQHHIEYKQPALLNDEIEIQTYGYGVRKATAHRYYAITHSSDGALLAHAHTRYVWVNLETGKPITIPADFLTDLGPNIADGDAS